jgi:glycosidase
VIGKLNPVKMAPIKSINDPEVQQTIRLTANHRNFFSSPVAWEDELLYFILPDRFSNNTERDYRDVNGRLVTAGTTPLFREEDKDNAIQDEKSWHKWKQAAETWVGGNLKGIISKIGYLERMGVTAIWLGPVLKQVKNAPTYHGYCPQNFLDIDPRFGTREDFRDMVAACHRAGIRVLSDVVINHCGDVWAYEKAVPGYQPEPHAVKGYRTHKKSNSQAFIPLDTIDEKKHPNAYPDVGLWPSEMQTADTFNRLGEIVNWEESPEYMDGDFFNLKKLNLGDTADHDEASSFEPGPALRTLVEVWKYWIAYADLDGFRIDACKHLGNGPLRHFVDEMRSFAHQIGKTNFLLVAEIAGPGAMAMVRETGLDGALGIGAIQEALWRTSQGLASPMDYFREFSNHRGSGGWFRDEVITMIDDHDQTWKNGLKARFGSTADAQQLLPATLGMNLCTIGIPCIYYGTEQSFDGASEPPPALADAYIREAMFGGQFGSFRSRNRHFFDENAPGYRIVKDLSRLRARETVLRRGAQYLRQISSDGSEFKVPELQMPAWINSMEDTSQIPVGPPLRCIVAWSRILDETEILCVINTDPTAVLEAWVVVDAGIHSRGRVMSCIYPARERPIKPVRSGGGCTAVRVRIGPGAFHMYK